MSLFDFCDDPFTGNASAGSDSAGPHSFAVKECQKPMYSSLRISDEPVCMKMKVFYASTNRTVIHRMCDWESDKKSKGSCRNKKVASDALIEYCGTCSTDSCNKGRSSQAWRLMIYFSICLNILFKL